MVGAKWPPLPLPRKTLLSILRRMHSGGGIPDVEFLAGTPFYKRTCEEFGTWEQALHVAGVLDPETAEVPVKRRRGGTIKWHPEDILVAIRERREQGLSLRMIDVLADNPSLCGAAVRRFDGWKMAVAVAGFDYDAIGRAERWYLKRVSRSEAQPRRSLTHGKVRIVPLDAPLRSNPKATRGDFIGELDPAFAQYEGRELLQALLDKRVLAKEMAVLIERLILGEDLEDEEYQRLAAAVRSHPQLLKLFEDALTP